MKIASYLFCLAAGAFLARFELHTDDTGVEVFFILAATFLLGCLHPRRAWQWPLLVGPWIPGAELLFGSGKQSLGSLGLLLAFVVALGLAGSYAGALVRRAATAARQAG
ncbi:MAG: hypothetical protein LAQ30_10680 [Acidobacteriia bacterium]|nr:hypothetical protein [Terriglobia bacterium]